MKTKFICASIDCRKMHFAANENEPHIQRSRHTLKPEKRLSLFFSYLFADGQFFDLYVANDDTKKKNHSTRQRMI